MCKNTIEIAVFEQKNAWAFVNVVSVFIHPNWTNVKKKRNFLSITLTLEVLFN